MIAAVVQLTSGGSVEANLERAGQWIERAARAGAELVALPENFAVMRPEGARPPHPDAQSATDGAIARFLSETARRLHIVLAGGTLPERIEGDSRIWNTSLVFGRAGEPLARYRKIHLFDVELGELTLRESSGVAAGAEIAVAKTELGTLGLSVCYDVRFPELYRALVDRGAEILLVPAAFTVPTGRDHWEVLLRARAIESQAFVVAAAQWGMHEGGRISFGRSLIADPWGTVLATVPDGEGFALAEIDLARLADVRRRLPSLRHRRL